MDDFYFIQQEDPQKVLEVIVSLVKDRIPKRFGLHPINDVQVLTPMQKGSVGGINLNVELQKALNHSTEGITRGGRRFLTGDKVMQIKNNYDKEIFNGDIGRIASVASELQEMTIIFDDREIVFDYFGVGRNYPCVCGIHPQIPGIRVSGDYCSNAYAALCYAATESSLHSGNQREEISGFNWFEEKPFL